MVLPVADSAENEAGFERDGVLSRIDSLLIRVFGRRWALHDSDRRYVRVSHDLDGSAQVSQDQASSPRLRCCGDTPEGLHLEALCEGRDRGLVEAGTLDVDVDVQGLEREQLGGGECGMARVSSSEHHYFLDLARPEGLQGVVGDVGGCEFLRLTEQQASDVESDVAVPDDHDPRCREVHLVLCVVGVAVVPADELGRREAALKMFTGNAELLAGGGSVGVDDRVVVEEEFVMADVVTDSGVEVDADAWVRKNPAEETGDFLGRLVVGRDAGADEPERRGQPIDQRDFHGNRAVLEKFSGCIEAGRAGTHDGDAQKTPGWDLREWWKICRAVDDRVGEEVGRVDLGVLPQVGCQLVDRFDRSHGAGVHASTAVDAGLRVDVEHLGGLVVGLVRSGVDAADRADGHA
jgi:hypothetical protein